MITGMTNHFNFHICWISVLKILYFNLFSNVLLITFLSDGTDTFISIVIIDIVIIVAVESAR